MSLLSSPIVSIILWAGALTDVQEVLDAQARAWNDGDIAGYMQGYWQSDSLVFTSGGNVRRGWQATFEKYLRTYDTREKMGILTFSELEVSILSENSALVLGKWELKRASDRPHGVFTLILRRFPDGWKIVHDHTSASMNE
jgi:ketosteroid isomerase-like protein